MLAGALEVGDEEDDDSAEASQYARRESRHGFVDKIAKFVGDQGYGGGIVGKDRPESSGVFVETLGEIAEVKLGFVEAGEISG